MAAERGTPPSPPPSPKANMLLERLFSLSPPGSIESMIMTVCNGEEWRGVVFMPGPVQQLRTSGRQHQHQVCCAPPPLPLSSHLYHTFITPLSHLHHTCVRTNEALTACIDDAAPPRRLVPPCRRAPLPR